MSAPRHDRGVLWQDEVRKLGGEHLVRVLEDICASQQRTCDRIKQMEGNIELTLQKHIDTAFAGGDPDGHRRAHETMINMMEERRRMYASIREKTISGLLWGALVWMGYAVLTKIRIELGMPP